MVGDSVKTQPTMRAAAPAPSSEADREQWKSQWAELSKQNWSDVRTAAALTEPAVEASRSFEDKSKQFRADCYRPVLSEFTLKPVESTAHIAQEDYSITDRHIEVWCRGELLCTPPELDYRRWNAGSHASSARRDLQSKCSGVCNPQLTEQGGDVFVSATKVGGIAYQPQSTETLQDFQKSQGPVASNEVRVNVSSYCRRGGTPAICIAASSTI